MRRMRMVVAVLALSMAVSAWAEVTYSVGAVPQFSIRQMTRIWQPILDAIHKETGVSLKLVGSPSIPDFEKSFSAGEYDFAYMNPYHAIVANRDVGYVPIVRDVGRQLYGIIVVRKDSPLQSLADLQGKTVAFPAPNALGAALIPRAEFATKYHVDIRPRYVNSHSSVYFNVLTGQADAGGGVQKTLKSQDQKVRAQLRVLYQTEKVAPHPVVVHPRVPREVVDRVRQAFLGLGDTHEGRLMLSRIPIKKIGAASLKDYAPLNAMGLEAFYVR